MLHMKDTFFFFAHGYMDCQKENYDQIVWINFKLQNQMKKIKIDKNTNI